MQRFHQKGYRVLIHCRDSLDAANTLADELNLKEPDSAAVLAQDLGQSKDLGKLMERAAETFGRLDCLVNNASVFYPTPLDQLDLSTIDQILDINLKAPILLAQSAAQLMSDGVIINIVDIYGERPLKGYLTYSISKAALQMLTRALALELAPDIRVNGVSPGAILWPEDLAEMSEKDKANLLDGIPMGSLGEPDDIARAVLFLAEEADFVTGQIITVDGGQSIA